MRVNSGGNNSVNPVSLDFGALQRRFKRNVWVIPGFVFIVLALGIVGLYLLLQRGERQRLLVETEIAAEQIRGQLKAWVDARVGITGLIADKISGYPSVPTDIFWYESRIAQRRFPGFQSLNWVDTDWIVQTVVPSADDEPGFGKNLRDHPSIAIPKAIERVAQTGRVARSQVIELLQGGEGFGSFWPVYDSEGRLAGYVIGVFRVDTIVDACLGDPALRDRFRFSLQEKAGQPFYVHASAVEGSGSTVRIQLPVRIVDLSWTLEISPRPPLINQFRTAGNELLLLCGLLLCGVLCWLLRRLLVRQFDLLLSEENHRLVVNHVNDALVIRQNDRLIFFNRRFAEMLGYPPPELQQKTFSELCTPSGIELLHRRMAAREHGHPAPNRYELVLRKKSGELLYTETNDTEIQESEGSAVFSVLRDVSERKQAEREREALQRLSQRLTGPMRVKELGEAIAEESRLLFAHDAFFLDFYVDSLDDMTTVYCEDTPPGQSEPVEVSPPGETSGRWSGNAQLINRGREHQPETLISFGFSSRRSQSLMFAPVRWEDRAVGVLSVQSYSPNRYEERDLQLLQAFADQCGGALARVRAEARNARLALAVDSAAEAIIVTEAQGHVLYVNPAFESITGYHRKEVRGQIPRLLQKGPHSESFHDELWRTLRQGRVWSGGFTNERKDGTPFDEEGTISPVRDSDGNVVNYVIVMRDITQERSLEAQLHHAQKLEAIGQLAGGVAHDFNNFLQVILGHAELGMKGLPLDEKAHYDLSQCHRAAEKATAVTQQLLAFSRRQMLQPLDLDLHRIISELAEMLRRIIGEHIELQFAPRAENAVVHADQGQIEQVIMNLCINARDALPEGGKIVVETGTVNANHLPSPFPAPPTAGRFVALSIQDNGPGIPLEVQERIFEPFFTTKGREGGTGLGLATVYGIVKQHQGIIQVDSAPGQGTTFRVYLPEVLHPKPVVPLPEIDLESSGGNETLLVAEDDDMVRELSLAVLAEAGYQTLIAQNGEEAVKQFEENAERIDMVMIDLVMPKMGGRDAYQRMQAIRPDVPVLFCTGYDVAGVEGSVFDCDERINLIQKPYNIPQLLRKVRQTLKRGEVPIGEGITARSISPFS